jgi:uncharacterized protein (TIGR02453 family)
MISKNVLDFLKALGKNNNKEWFHAHKDRYLEIKDEFEKVVTHILIGMSKFDKTLKQLDPKKCIFRIYRDIRFSHDKTPYKTNIGAWFGRDGKFGSSAGYYLHIEPGEYFFSGGIYMPQSDVLKAVRTEIYNYNDEFKKIIYSKTVKKLFGGLWDADMLKKAPKDFSPDFEDIDLLKYKHYILNKDLTVKDVMSKNYIKTAVETFHAMHPFIQFLNRAIDENPSK